MKKIIIAIAALAISTPAFLAAPVSAQDKPLTVGQRVTFSDAVMPLDYFGCRNIENTKQAYRVWFDRRGSELGRLAANRFFWEHDLDPTRADRERTLNDECQAFPPGDARYIEKVSEWNDGHGRTLQMICLGAHDFDVSPPDENREPSPKSSCFWMVASFMPPMILRR